MAGNELKGDQSTQFRMAQAPSDLSYYYKEQWNYELYKGLYGFHPFLFKHIVTNFVSCPFQSWYLSLFSK